jgi:hypothetical protein
VALARQFAADQVVYQWALMIFLPSRCPLAAAPAEARMVTALGWMQREADWLRIKGCTYSYLRAYAVSLTQIGLLSGTLAYEFFQAHPMIHDTAQRIRQANYPVITRAGCISCRDLTV